MKQKFLITGTAGFIDFHFIERFIIEGYDVYDPWANTEELINEQVLIVINDTPTADSRD